MHGLLRMRERRAGLFEEDTPGIREFDNPSLMASEQVKSVLGFEIGNLFAERYGLLLTDAQSMSPTNVGYSPIVGVKSPAQGSLSKNR